MQKYSYLQLTLLIVYLAESITIVQLNVVHLNPANLIILKKAPLLASIL